MVGSQSEREDKVSLELSEEILQSMEVGMSFRDYNGRISSMDFHKSSSYLVTASDDESIRLYDVTAATCLKTINSKKYGVDLVCFTSHPTTVIYSSKNGWDGMFIGTFVLCMLVDYFTRHLFETFIYSESLRLLSLHDNKYLRYFKGHHDRVVSLSLCSSKDCFISGSLDRTVLLWDQRAEKCQGLLRVQGRPAAAYDDQGLVFAVAFGGYIRMFDARKYEKGPFDIFSVGGDISDANVVKFSNDGRLMLLTTMEGHIHVLDSFRGTLLSTYNVKPVSRNSTLEASFSPEGMFVISGSGDGSVYAWSVRSGKEVASWMSFDTEPPVIKWTPGSLMFVTGSSELSFWIPDLSKLGAYVGRK
ncbi:WD REPEATS REGION domain-containing protein [Citrus sinensis]|uniref:WD REPEATS REGION domain-containing protein n=1 Tax=Citrus sinensis TaxID=2711 RepID=A0ACB8K8W2_CITSI|nr:WD REPEATS REGION domain-containing protein [Citrus sinensis]